jgi:hypothetical protein
MAPVANSPPLSTTPTANFATSSAGVVDTGGKFATGVSDTGGKFSIGVKDAGSNLQPVSTTPTPAANLPPVSMTPVVHLEPRISKIFETALILNGFKYAGR